MIDLALALALAAAPVWRPVDPAHTLVIDTIRGRAIVELRPELAPRSVERVETLARRGTYDGLQFHRVLAGRFAQTGNPNNRDGGGTELPDLKLEAARRQQVHLWTVVSNPSDGLFGFVGAQPWASTKPDDQARATVWGVYCEGVMGMGRQAAPDTGNSEIFFTFRPERAFDHDYAVVGRVVVGLDALRAVSAGEPPPAPDRMLRVRVLADLPPRDRPTVEVEDTDAPPFQTRADRMRRRRGADFSICDLSVPARVR